MAVAASGGRDSTALLHCAAQAAHHLGVGVHALHVQHGLHPDAEKWADHLRQQTQHWAAAGGLPVQFHLHRITEQPASGDSIEAWARARRYAALADMARKAECSMILLAHHRSDQAETVMLQALRGAGTAGMAAMPRFAVRDGLSWARPWLDKPRDLIDAYVQHHDLEYVDDPSNSDPRFARNRLRQAVWPAFEAAFPDAEAALVAVAHQAQDSLACLQEIAQLDLALVADATGLRIAAWLSLSEARRLNALRAWLVEALPGGVTRNLLHRLMKELPTGRGAVWQTATPAGQGMLRLHRGVLQFQAASSTVISPLVAARRKSRPG